MGLAAYRGPRVLVTAGVCPVAVHILAAAAWQPHALSLVSAIVTPAAVRPLVNIAASSRGVKAPTGPDAYHARSPIDAARSAWQAANPTTG